MEKDLIIVEQGTSADAYFIITRGVFEVLVNGQKVVEMGPGGSFGENALVNGSARTATVVAMTDGALLRIDGALLRLHLAP